MSRVLHRGGDRGHGVYIVEPSIMALQPTDCLLSRPLHPIIDSFLDQVFGGSMGIPHGRDEIPD